MKKYQSRITDLLKTITSTASCKCSKLCGNVFKMGAVEAHQVISCRLGLYRLLRVYKVACRYETHYFCSVYGQFQKFGFYSCMETFVHFFRCEECVVTSKSRALLWVGVPLIVMGIQQLHLLPPSFTTSPSLTPLPHPNFISALISPHFSYLLQPFPLLFTLSHFSLNLNHFSSSPPSLASPLSSTLSNWTRPPILSRFSLSLSQFSPSTSSSSVLAHQVFKERPNFKVCDCLPGKVWVQPRHKSHHRK